MLYAMKYCSTPVVVRSSTYTQKFLQRILLHRISWCSARIYSRWRSRSYIYGHWEEAFIPLMLYSLQSTWYTIGKIFSWLRAWGVFTLWPHYTAVPVIRCSWLAVCVTNSQLICYVRVVTYGYLSVEHIDTSFDFIYLCDLCRYCLFIFICQLTFLHCQVADSSYFHWEIIG